MGSCQSEKEPVVTIQTKFGDMKLILFDQTPKHKENFLKLAKEKAYDSTIFHRVINEFMIQGGDINLKPNVDEKIEYTVPAEFNDKLFHRKGAVCAARMGDQVNPEKASSGCQFYIVHGKKFDPNEALFGALVSKLGFVFQDTTYKELQQKLMTVQQNADREAFMNLVIEAQPIIEEKYGPTEVPQLTEAQQKAYGEHGGAPHLDGAYTVFGQVIEGLEVIDAIAAVQTAAMDKPVTDVFMNVKVEEMDKTDIIAKYGDVFYAE